MNSGEVIGGLRTVPLCPNCRMVNIVYEHEGDIFECGHCDQLYTFNPIGRRVPDDTLDETTEEPERHGPT